jgi:hypothetical protein
MPPRSTLLLVASAALAAAAGGLNPASRLTLSGLGPARIGMTESQLRHALPIPLEKVVFDSETACFYLAPKPDNGLSFLFLHRRLARIDVHANTWQTLSGVRIGDNETRVRQVYRAAVHQEPHHYTDGKYLSIRSTAPAYRNRELRFETDEKGVISTFRAGSVEATRLVEGCA